MSLVTEYSWGEAREEIGQVSRDEFIRCDEEFRIRSVGDFKSLIDSDCVRHDAMLRSPWQQWENRWEEQKWKLGGYKALARNNECTKALAEARRETTYMGDLI